MRKVNVSERKLFDTETGQDIICPLTSNPCTPDCVAFECSTEKNKVYCCWPKSEKVLVIGELVEEAK